MFFAVLFFPPLWVRPEEGDPRPAGKQRAAHPAAAGGVSGGSGHREKGPRGRARTTRAGGGGERSMVFLVVYLLRICVCVLCLLACFSVCFVCVMFFLFVFVVCLGSLPACLALLACSLACLPYCVFDNEVAIVSHLSFVFALVFCLFICSFVSLFVFFSPRDCFFEPPS